MRQRSELMKQVILFLLVGGVTFLIDVTVTSLAYYYLHTPAYLASAIGFLSGFFFNFPINRNKVFRHSNDDRFSLRAQVILYWGLSLTNLVVTSALVELLVTSRVFDIQYAKIAVTLLIAIWNFLLFKFFIFSKVDRDKSLNQPTK